MNQAPGLRTLCGLAAELRKIIYELAIYEPHVLYLTRPRSRHDDDHCQSGPSIIANESRSALTLWSLRSTCRAIKKDLDQLQTFYRVNTFYFLPYDICLCKNTIAPEAWNAIRNVVLDINSHQFDNEEIWAVVQRECFTRESLTLESCDTASALSPEGGQIEAFDRFADMLRSYVGPCNLKNFKLRYTLMNYYGWRGVPISVTYTLTAESDRSFVELQAPAEMALLTPALARRLVKRFPKKTRKKFLAIKKVVLGWRTRGIASLVELRKRDDGKAVWVEDSLGAEPGADGSDLDDEEAVNASWYEDDDEQGDNEDDAMFLEKLYNRSVISALAAAASEAGGGQDLPTPDEQTARTLEQLG